MIEDKNPLQTAAQDAGTGLAAGAGLGKLAGKIHEKTPRIKDLDEVLDKRQDWGIAYRKQSGKPEEAVDKLLQEKQGFVPKAFNKDGIGDVDLVWGKHSAPKEGKRKGSGYGLKHIIERRIEDGDDGYKFVNDLPSIFKNGKSVLKEGHSDRIYVDNHNKEAAIRTNFDGKKRQWLTSAYFKNDVSPQDKAGSRTSDLTRADKQSFPLSDLQRDSSNIPEKSSYFNSFSDWLEEVKCRRGHK